MGIISWVVIGAIAGVVARRIVPGPDPGRSIITIILGMAGASLGGFVFGVLGGGVTSFGTVLTGSNVGCSLSAVPLRLGRTTNSLTSKREGAMEKESSWALSRR